MPELVEINAAPKRTGYPEAARALLRDTLLDAAAELLAERAWSEITMAAVATQAGVSRQTLYNEFGSRDEFAQAYALREADRFLTLVEDEIRAHPTDPHAALTAAFSMFLRSAESNPMVRAILVREPGGDDLLALFTTRGAPVVEFATARISAVILELWPIKDLEAVGIAAEAVVRLAISHAGLPTAGVDQAAYALGVLAGPYLETVLEREGIAFKSSRTVPGANGR